MGFELIANTSRAMMMAALALRLMLFSTRLWYLPACTADIRNFEFDLSPRRAMSLVGMRIDSAH